MYKPTYKIYKSAFLLKNIFLLNKIKVREKYMKELVNKQRNFFNSNKTLDYNFRLKQLKKLYNIVCQNENLISEALYKDLNKSESESYMTEIMIIKKEIKYFISNLKSLMKPKKVASPITIFPSSAFIYKEPLGLSLIISPWNYPIQLSLCPLATAIAAGCCAILKPSEYSTNSSNLLKNIISKNFEEDYIAVVTGGVSESTKLLNEKFDKIFFTGNSTVGKIVMEKATKNLTSVTLELGGKSPCIVDESANIDITAKRIIWGKLINAGQTCVAPDYIFVHSSIKDLLIKKLIFYIEKFYGNDLLNNPLYPKIITKHHYDRAKKLLDNETIIFGGNFDDEKLKIEATLIDNPQSDSPLLKEEIFSPILPIINYDNLDNLILSLKEKEKSLALYIFSNNKININKIITNISYGGGCVNDTIVHLMPHNLPFGGVGNSGMGKYHGKAGFDDFSNTKSIVKKPFFLDLPFKYPPYINKIKLFKFFEKF